MIWEAKQREEKAKSSDSHAFLCVYVHVQTYILICSTSRTFVAHVRRYRSSQWDSMRSQWLPKSNLFIHGLKKKLLLTLKCESSSSSSSSLTSEHIRHHLHGIRLLGVLQLCHIVVKCNITHLHSLIQMALSLVTYWTVQEPSRREKARAFVMSGVGGWTYGCVLEALGASVNFHSCQTHKCISRKN